MGIKTGFRCRAVRPVPVTVATGTAFDEAAVSTLGGEIAVDFESDADLDENRLCPSHLTSST